MPSAASRQDFAHLRFSPRMRAIGLAAARYVSGHLETEPPPGEATKLVRAPTRRTPGSPMYGTLTPGWLDFDPDERPSLSASTAT